MIGTRINQYQILDKLGQGGMGVVYLARDTGLGRNVALKFLPEDSRDNQTARARFMSEAKAAAAIDHPYICKIYEAAESDGRAFIAMEHVEGETLDARLEKERLSLRDLIRIGARIADALATAHQRGFVHRDLKPANLMITSQGHVKVMDFGLARRFAGAEDETTQARMTGPGRIVGTVNYMSPEQLSGKGIDARSDLFSLGVLLHEALTGTHPFRKQTILQTATAILHENPPPITKVRHDCPAVLEELISMLLSKDREKRGNAAMVRDRLTDLLEGSAAPPGQTAAPLLESILVLPFVGIGSSAEDDYFADGITEEIITQLGSVRGLKVISRTTAMRYKGTDKDIGSIAGEIGVDSILEGSIRRSGDRVRISCKLLDAGSERRLWAESYDRRLEDIFTLQSQVSRSIVEALQTRLSGTEISLPEWKPAGSPEAYTEYLKGRYFLNKVTVEGTGKAIEHFRAALDLDPVFALAYAGMSRAYANAGYFGYPVPHDPFPKARAAAMKALEFDASLAEAHVAMALVKLLHEWDWDGAEQEFTAALRCNPNDADARAFFAWYLAAMGRLGEAIAEARGSVAIDPLSPFTNMNLGWVLFYARRYDESIDQLHKTLEIAPGFPHALMSLACSYLMVDRHDEGIEIFEKVAFSPLQIAQAYATAGRHGRAREILAELQSDQTPVPGFDMATLLFFLGEEEPAFEWLEKALEQRDPRVIYMRNFPPMEPYRDHPRLIEILSRVGLAS